MSEQLQLRRGTAAQVASFTGAQGETVVDTTNNRLVVQDGTTPGGWPAAKLAEVIVNTRTAVSDANYSALISDRSIAYTAITAPRMVALPSAASYQTGTPLTIFDESGGCSATNTITVARAGSDTIDGATSAAMASAYAYLALQSNGSGKWTIVDQSTLSMAQQAASAVAISGGTINGTTIGATTPEPGSFTTLSTSGNAVFGTSITGSVAAPFTMDFGTSYGDSPPGSSANLKWLMFHAAGDQFGIGMSTGLMEYQAGTSGGHEFFVNLGTPALAITAAGVTQPTGPLATGTVGTSSVLEIVCPQSNGTSYPQVAAFNVGRYAAPVSYSPNTRLDIALKAALNSTVSADTTIMTLQSNGNVGIGTTTPAAPLDVAGTIQSHGPNGSNVQFGVIEGLIACSGASSVSTQQIPNRAIVFAVSVYVTAAITGATSFNVDATTNSSGGAGTTAGQFGSGLGIAAGSNNAGVIGPTAWYAASTIKLTAAGGSFTGGSVRISIQYMLCNPPTS